MRSGNLTADPATTYEWDAANRLIAINDGSHRSEFAYNGLSQRTKIVEIDNGNVSEIKEFVWCTGEAQPSEERDATGSTTTKRFFADGEERVGGAGAGVYYYTRDHLGSIREATDSNGELVARMDYDPSGNKIVVVGNTNIDFGFTGHYFHQPSGLNLAIYRAYSPPLGKWVSRDPIQERDGLNLYAYVKNDPVLNLDPIGLASSVGGEAHFFVGGGFTRVSCCDENGDKHLMWFSKVCIGGAVGVGGGGAYVTGLSGSRCRRENYEGWFYEAGYSVGSVGGNLNVGVNGSGYSGVNEIGGGPGKSLPGVKFKSTWCYYIFIDQSVQKCGCK